MTNFCLHQVHRTLSPRSSVHDTQWNEEKDLEKRKKKESEQKTRGMIFEASHVATMLRSSSSDLRCYTRDRWKLIEMDDRFIRSSLFLSFFLLSYLSSIFFFFFFFLNVRKTGWWLPRVSRVRHLIRSRNSQHEDTLRFWTNHASMCTSASITLSHT